MSWIKYRDGSVIKNYSVGWYKGESIRKGTVMIYCNGEEVMSAGSDRVMGEGCWGRDDRSALMG